MNADRTASEQNAHENSTKHNDVCEHKIQPTNKKITILSYCLKHFRKTALTVIS